MKSLLQISSHRRWPVPHRPWIMAQSWHDLLFAHWPVPRADLRPLVPAQLELDLYHGQAWLGVVPFRMSGVRLRGMPSLPWLSVFPELNVRTYVVKNQKPGVWFFSLDAGNPVAVAVARAWFHLPYFRARMQCERENDYVRYQSERTHRGAAPASLRCAYRAVGEAFHPQPDTLEHFFTERYCLYALGKEGKLIRGEIHHPPWSLQEAQADFAVNSMAEAAGLLLPSEKPLLHFSRRQDMVAWPPQSLVP